MKIRPLFTHDPYRLTDHGRQVIHKRLMALEAKRIRFIRDFQKQYAERTPSTSELADGIASLQKITNEMERLDTIMGHAAALTVQQRA